MRVPFPCRCLSRSVNRPIPVVPKCLPVGRRVRDPLAAENFGMHAGNQHLLIVRPVENADLATLRQVAGGAPKKIMLQLGGAGMLEAEDLATLRIDPGHHVPDGTILSRRIHRLEDQQDSMTVGRIKELLQRAQPCDMLCQQFLVVLFRGIIQTGSTFVGHFLRLTSSPSRTRKSFELIFILILSAVTFIRVALSPVASQPFRISCSAWSQS